MLQQMHLVRSCSREGMCQQACSRTSETGLNLQCYTDKIMNACTGECSILERMDMRLAMLSHESLSHAALLTTFQMACSAMNKQNWG